VSVRANPPNAELFFRERQTIYISAARRAFYCSDITAAADEPARTTRIEV
jgi:hypothetical protein